ncbi:4'-phosphopantetheinyl transferase superfamily protein [Mycoplasma struthionis]|uniref:4'-phosphopantetheinyl transferase superfamily protein n=1 Tax=Mycoplasma struthionis TaxID=538220 RepID=A0A3G8LG91_9MOLU|nr:4'-phosphopantetheinyl transferase superfamily protein [Mycoplasma struthionis]AZG68679.1 4'-phosphopantetheinyl transferase superfamily protein [Mycoplasma struthionis]TPI01929.1 4'-phosphopantetheinyl transferase superfamily protein [Mycoplasma struthionis]
MIGIDITKIKRFRNLKAKVIEKILHLEEFEEFQKLQKKDKPQFLATRWALKEAIFKCDNKFINFKKVRINKDPSGRYIFENFNLSTSNDCGLVVAVAEK